MIDARDCDGDAGRCTYQEPHRHGFDCDKTCSCHSLEALDFSVTCAMTHMGKHCERPATHLVTIHRCGRLNGLRAPVCAYAMRVFEVVPYPVLCRCGMTMKERADYAWNIEPL